MKKERFQFKDASDKFIKDKVKGYDQLGKSEKSSRKKAPTKRTLRLNTDDTLSKYPNAFAAEAASPDVKSKHQDAKMDVKSKRDEFKDIMRSRGLDQKKYKRRK